MRGLSHERSPFFGVLITCFLGFLFCTACVVENPGNTTEGTDTGTDSISGTGTPAMPSDTSAAPGTGTTSDMSAPSDTGSGLTPSSGTGNPTDVGGDTDTVVNTASGGSTDVGSSDTVTGVDTGSGTPIGTDGEVSTDTDSAPGTGTDTDVPLDTELFFDDRIECTVDACANGECTHTLQAGFCLIDRVCYHDGAMNPQSSCQHCDVVFSTEIWRNQPDGTACDDGNLCTQTDTCQQGVCQGADPVSCEALDQCHLAGTCDPQSGCSDPLAPVETVCTHPTNDPAHCNEDGQCIRDDCTCEGSDICCVNNCTVGPGAAGDACEDDGLSCTDDLCTEDGSCKHTLNATSCLIGDLCYAEGEHIDSPIDPHCYVCIPSENPEDWSTPAGLVEDPCNNIDDDCDGELNEWSGAQDPFEPNDKPEASVLVAENITENQVNTPSDDGKTWFHSELEVDYFHFTQQATSGLLDFWLCRVVDLLEGQTVRIWLDATGQTGQWSDTLSNTGYFVLPTDWGAIRYQDVTFTVGIEPVSGFTSCDHTYTLECKVSDSSSWLIKIPFPDLGL